MYTAKQQRTITEALSIIAEQFKREDLTANSPQSVANYLQLSIADREHEVFLVLHLDTQHRLIEAEELFRGTIDGAAVYPREVAKSCLQKNSAAVVLAHNHPSGVAEPSQADIRITERLVAALEVLEIRVLDHVVVAVAGHCSLRERGLL